MSEPKFTPGPWHVTSCMDYWVEHSQPREKEDDGFRGVAHVGDVSWPNSDARQKEWEANARLIAAAPDLYVSLDAFMKYVGEEKSSDPFTPDGWKEITAACRAALAKARGE